MLIYKNWTISLSAVHSVQWLPCKEVTQYSSESSNKYAHHISNRRGWNLIFLIAFSLVLVLSSCVYLLAFLMSMNVSKICIFHVFVLFFLLSNHTCSPKKTELFFCRYWYHFRCSRINSKGYYMMKKTRRLFDR